MDEIGIEQARLTLGDIVDRARLVNQPTRLTRQGKPAAVVVGERWFEQAVAIAEIAHRALTCGGLSADDMEGLRDLKRKGMVL